MPVGGAPRHRAIQEPRVRHAAGVRGHRRQAANDLSDRHRAGGGYALRIGVYFPGSRTIDRTPAESANFYEPDCTFDEIKAGVNKNLTRDDQINFPEPLLINYITASVEGIEGKALIGAQGTDILSYAGKSSILEFPIKDEATLAFGRRAPALRYAAQLRHGVLGAHGRWLREGRRRSPTGRRCALGRLREAVSCGYLRKRSRAQDEARAGPEHHGVDLEGSSDQAFNDLAQKIIDKIILSNPAIAVKPADLPPGVSVPVAPGTGSLTTPATVPATPAADSPAKTSIAININAAVEALRAVSSIHYEATKNSALVQKTYTTWTIIKADYAGAGVEEVHPSSDDAHGDIYPKAVTRGTTLSIVPVSRTTEDLTYAATAEYFDSKKALLSREHAMGDRFNLLSNYPNWVKDLNDGPSYMYAESGWKPWTYVSNWSYYNWGFEKTETYVGNRVVQHVTDKTFDDYLDKVQVEFSNGGKLYTLRQLSRAKLTKGDPVDGSLDSATQRVVIVPGANLGQVTLHNADEFENDVEYYKIRYFQRHMGGYGRGQTGLIYSPWEKPTMVPSHRSIYKVRLIADQGTTISPSGITVSGGDGALHGPKP